MKKSLITRWYYDEEDELAADMDEGAVKNAMIDDAEGMDKEDFCEKYMAQGMDRAECEEHNGRLKQNPRILF